MDCDAIYDIITVQYVIRQEQVNALITYQHVEEKIPFFSITVELRATSWQHHRLQMPIRRKVRGLSEDSLCHFFESVLFTDPFYTPYIYCEWKGTKREKERERD
jgi:hypothetical protein